MTLEFKADVQRVPNGYKAIVNEYKHGTFTKSYEFADLPVYENLMDAFSHSRREAEELNRRIRHEER